MKSLNQFGVITAGCLAALGLLGAEARAAVAFQFGETGVSYDIPDNDGGGVARSYTAISFSSAEPFTLTVSLTLEATGFGAYNGDYYAYLYHETPGGGTSVMSVLLSRAGRDPDHLSGSAGSGFTVDFSDDALADVHTYEATLGSPLAGVLTGTWQPDGRGTDPLEVLTADSRTLPLSPLAGLDPNGTWTLFVSDLEMGGTARLTDWQVTANTAEPVPESATWFSAVGFVALGAGAWGWRRHTRNR